MSETAPSKAISVVHNEYFAELATVKSARQSVSQLRLIKLHKPFISEGRLVTHSVDSYLLAEDLLTGEKTAERKSRWYLPFNTTIAAQMWLAEIGQIKRHRDELNLQRQEEAFSKAPKVNPSALNIHLAKSYPNTMKALDEGRQDDALKAYTKETFALTGHLVEPVSNGEEIEEMARMRANVKRAKCPPRDPAELELILGWESKGYGQMKLEGRTEAINKATHSSLTSEAVRQKCNRLGLKSLVPPGKPDKTAS